MPRVAEKERLKANHLLENYLKPFFDNPGNDERSLSVAGISRNLKISRNTLKKHNLLCRIEEAQKVRAYLRPARGSLQLQLLRRQLQAAREESKAWRARYEFLLEQYLRIEFHLRHSTKIDLDKLLATAIPKPSRIEPERQARKRFTKNLVQDID